MDKRNSKAGRDSQHSKKSFAEYLIESDIKLLVFTGKSMHYFGMNVVIGFIAGMVVIYTYALFKPLPYTEGVREKEIVTRPEKEVIFLQGKVLTLEDKPLNSYEIGVLESRHGPIVDNQGEFAIKVPHKEKYDILVWTPGYKVFKLYGDQNIVKNEGGRYSLNNDLRAFPTNLGILEGTVIDQDGRPVAGYVEIAGKIVKIESNGGFRLTSIPLGESTVFVCEDINGKILYKKDISVQLTAPTPFPIIVKKAE
jgi:hypothetical protein